MPKRTPVHLEDGAVAIPLTRGLHALIDPESLDLVGDHLWMTLKGRHTFYAARTVEAEGQKTTVLMHRIILGLTVGDGLVADHINRNGLDNRRKNLRAVSVAENHANAPGRRGTTSRYKGVYWNSHEGKWHAEIKSDGRRHSLRYHRDEEAAALAYDKAACELWGDLALLNLPVPQPISG